MTDTRSSTRHLSPVGPPPKREMPRHLDGREVLSLAKGILIAGRGYSDAQAFDELLDVSRRHHLTVHCAAMSLLDRATGTPTRRHTPEPITFPEWDGLIAALPPRRRAS